MRFPKQKEDLTHLAIGAISMAFANNTKELSREGNLEKLALNYGTDILGPFGFYMVARHFEIQPKKALGILAATVTVSEILDYFHLKGTYDPKDFLAYAVGLGSAYTLDRILQSKSSPQKPSSQ